MDPNPDTFLYPRSTDSPVGCWLSARHSRTHGHLTDVRCFENRKSLALCFGTLCLLDEDYHRITDVKPEHEGIRGRRKGSQFLYSSKVNQSGEQQQPAVLVAFETNNLLKKHMISL